MAKQQSQLIQVMLFVFVGLAALFGIVTIALWVHSNGVSAERDELQTRATTAEGNLRAAESEVQDLKSMIGFAPDASKEAIDQEFAKDAAIYGAGLDETQRSYRQFCQTLLGAAQEKTTQLLQAQETERKLLADLQAARDEAQRVRQELEQAKQTAEQTYLAARQELSARHQQDDQQKQQLVSQLDEKTRQLAKIEDDYKKQLAAVQTELDNLRLQLTRAKEELNSYSGKTFEVPDGEVTWVNQRTGTVWLNRGRQDGLRPNVTFSVFERGATSLEGAVKKGSIEVTQVQNGHTAEARILEDDHTNPIMPGDLIASPVWNAGSTLHFALVGKMDINNDSRDDRQLIKNLIRMTGGEIDAEDTAEGTVEGTLSVHTRYLVLGEQPTDTSEAARIRTYSDMVREATRLGIEQISVHKLIDAMGFGSRVRSVIESGVLETELLENAAGASPDRASQRPARRQPPR